MLGWRWRKRAQPACFLVPGGAHPQATDRLTGEKKIDPAKHVCGQRIVLLCQLAGTAAILGWVPGNLLKLAALLFVWGFTFWPLTLAELLVMGGVNLLFTLMNSLALARGLFRFDHPDFFGMPAYEYLMWGFYAVHAIRFLGRAPSRDGLLIPLALAALFTVPFATIADPALLLLISGVTLAFCFAVFHEPSDWIYAGYMAAIGSVIEHVGVATEQWHYPEAHPATIPLWSVTMWAGVGLFTRRLILPLLRRLSAAGRHSCVER